MKITDLFIGDDIVIEGLECTVEEFREMINSLPQFKSNIVECPKKKQKLADKLRDNIETGEKPICPRCNSTNTTSKGIISGKQRRLCLACNKYFTPGVAPKEGYKEATPPPTPNP